MVVGKSARDNTERYCGWFLVLCSSTEILNNGTRGHGDMFAIVLNESGKSRFDSYSVTNSVLSISRITFRDCRVHTFFRSKPKKLLTIS